jgi:hypothetical protein
MELPKKTDSSETKSEPAFDFHSPSVFGVSHALIYEPQSIGINLQHIGLTIKII